MQPRSSPYLVLSLLLCIGTPTAQAQQAQVRLARGPHYAGAPVIIDISADGFDDDPPPSVTAPDPAKGLLTYLGVVGTSQSIIIINGRQSVDSTQSYRFRFLTDEPGRYTIGPFTVQQGTKQARAAAVTIELSEVPASEDMRIRMVLPEKPVYAGQRVPMAVEWWVKESAKDRLLDRPSYSFSIPLFMIGSSFGFIDREVARGDNALTFATDAGEVQVKIDLERRGEGGASFLVLSAPRTLLLHKPGEYDLGSASVTADQIVGWVRDTSGFFTRREPRFEKIRARDLPRSLMVRDLPLAGRPESYAGAIGRGFTLEASADRTVVQAGDPITLTLTVRGEGNLDTAGLPALSADGGLSPEQFRLPDGEAAGIIQEDGSKIFTVKVRVRDAGVREIPALAFSWFDADSAHYETTHSRPIALAVRAGEVVTSRDAVGGAGPAGPESSTPANQPADGAPAGAAAAARPMFTLTGADLSLSVGQALLRSEVDRFGGRAALFGLYAVPTVLLGLAVVARRRADVDPMLIQRRRRLAEAEKRIEAAAGQARREGTRQIAAALRELVAEVPAARTPELEQLLAECDVIVYDPGGDRAQTVEETQVRRAADIARAIRERHASKD